MILKDFTTQEPILTQNLTGGYVRGRISIITPTFNSAETIRDTIESVLAQDYPDIEHIIVDGGSTDGTMSVVLSYANQLARVLSEKDEGIYDAMNKGIRMATGEFIGILNSDDFYATPEVLSLVVQTLSHFRAEAVYGDLVYVDRNDTKKISRTWISGEMNPEKFLYGWMVPHPTFFVRREVYETYGLYNTELNISSDYEMMIRLLYKNQIKARYIPEVLVNMRTGGNSSGNLIRRLEIQRQDRQAWRLNGEKPKLFTIPLKPIRKIPQLLKGMLSR